MSVCLLESESWFLFFSSNEGAPQIQLGSSFSKVGTQKVVRPWSQTKLQHSLLILLFTDLLLLFFLCSLLLSLRLSSGVFFGGGQSLQALSLFPPPLSHAGSLLLAVHFYSSLRAAPVIPSTALGILLLILSSLLAYAGKTRKAASL